MLRREFCRERLRPRAQAIVVRCYLGRRRLCCLSMLHQLDLDVFVQRSQQLDQFGVKRSAFLEGCMEFGQGLFQIVGAHVDASSR